MKHYDEISPFSQNILHKKNTNSTGANLIIFFKKFW
jgi:hypothetical protein